MTSVNLRRIADAVRHAYPSAHVREGINVLDVQVGGRSFVVRYLSRWGFGVDELREFEHPFDDFYKYLEPTANDAVARLLSLIKGRAT